MKTFEYTTRLISGEKWEETCSEMGAAGWEWITHHWSHLDDHGRLLDSYVVFFKRDVQRWVERANDRPAERSEGG